MNDDEMASGAGKCLVFDIELSGQPFRLAIHDDQLYVGVEELDAKIPKDERRNFFRDLGTYLGMELAASKRRGHFLALPIKAVIDSARLMSLASGEQLETLASSSDVQPCKVASIRCAGTRLVYQPDEVEALQRQQHKPDREVAACWERLADGNPERKVAVAPKVRVLESLREEFPHFADVLDYLHQSIALAGLAPGNAPMCLAPILLLGDPGLGKTLFAKRLAAACGSEYHELHMENLSAGFGLSGLHSGWSSGQTGEIFNKLIEGGFINPFILVDELDKPAGESKSNPYSPFYGLLEKHTAARFRDEFARVHLDASHITWVFTANTLDGIPKPLLSRIRVFTIPRPSRVQAQQIAAKIYNHIVATENWGGAFTKTLPDNLCEMLADKSPREINLILHDAFGHAAAKNSRQLEHEDILLATPGEPPRQRRAGFITD